MIQEYLQPVSGPVNSKTTPATQFKSLCGLWPSIIALGCRLRRLPVVAEIRKLFSSSFFPSHSCLPACSQQIFKTKTTNPFSNYGLLALFWGASCHVLNVDMLCQAYLLFVSLLFACCRYKCKMPWKLQWKVMTRTSWSNTCKRMRHRHVFFFTRSSLWMIVYLIP